MKKTFILLVFGLILFCCAILSAQITNTNIYTYQEPTVKSSAGNYFVLIIKTLFISALFIGAVYYLFKFIAKKQGVANINPDVVRILGITPVGPNRFLQIIEIGRKVFLIGNTENSINLLTEITDKETIDIIKTSASQQIISPKISFTEHLMNFIKSNLSGRKIESEKKTTGFAGLDFLKKQTKRLRDGFSSSHS